MPAYKSGKKTQQYLTEFKVTAVRLSLREGATKSVALSLDIHPYMLSKWRKDYREGGILEDKRKKRTKIPSQKAESSRIAELERQNEQLKLENDLLKKWQRSLPKKIDKIPIHSPLQNALFHCIDVPFSICF